MIATDSFLVFIVQAVVTLLALCLGVIFAHPAASRLLAKRFTGTHPVDQAPRAGDAAQNRPALSRLDDLIALCIAIVMVIFLYLTITPVVAIDSVREHLDARDCVEFDVCPAFGPPTSYGGFRQGTVIYQFLVFARFLHLGSRGTLLLLCGLSSLAAVVVYFSSRRFCGRINAVAAAVVFAIVISAYAHVAELWGPALTALPVALFFEYLALFAAGRKVGSAAAAGCFAALVAQVHFGGSLLAPFLALVVIAFAADPTRALVAAAFGYLGIWMSNGSSVLFLNLDALERLLSAQHEVALLVGSMAIPLVVGVLLRLGAPRVSDRAAAAYLLVGGGTMLFFIVGAGVIHRQVADQYVACFLPGLVLLPNAIGRLLALPWVRLPFARLQSIVACVIVPLCWQLCLLSSSPTEPLGRFNEPTWRDAERIADVLYGRGLSFADLHERLVGPRAFELQNALALLEPHFLEDAPRFHQDIAVIKTSSTALPSPPPANWQVVQLDGGMSAVIRAIDPYLDRHRPRVCFTPLPEGAPMDCFSVKTNGAPSTEVGTPFGKRSHPGMWEQSRESMHHHSGPFRIRYFFPVRVPKGAPRHVLSVSGPWEFIFEGSTRPAGSDKSAPEKRAMELDGSVDTVSIERAYLDKGDFGGWNGFFLPDLFETSLDEAALRDLVDAQETRVPIP